MREFSTIWPAADHPKSGWVGSENPWDASDFISKCIVALGANVSEEASTALDRLAKMPETNYKDQIKHHRAAQRRTRRDREYERPTFIEVKRCLSTNLPGTIDDLKALTVDHLDSVQKYIRDGDTVASEVFWAAGATKKEEICRDRLLDLLRPKMPTVSIVNPESQMPDRKRVDILVSYDGKAIPIEIKGQWHSDLWNAASVQLDEKYARDWRSDGRGIYLVLWFGEGSGKKLPRHPEGLTAPSNPEELREMLMARLTDIQRARIDVIVMDVTQPSGMS